MHWICIENENVLFEIDRFFWGLQDELRNNLEKIVSMWQPKSATTLYVYKLGPYHRELLLPAPSQCPPSVCPADRHEATYSPTSQPFSPSPPPPCRTPPTPPPPPPSGLAGRGCSGPSEVDLETLFRSSGQEGGRCPEEGLLICTSSFCVFQLEKASPFDFHSLMKC